MKLEQENNARQNWQLVEETFDPKANLLRETLFALANGYIGIRGTHEEAFATLTGKSLEGTFINGFYEASRIHHPEVAYGLAKEHEFMLNVPNGKCINFSIEDENFDLSCGEIVNYNRSVDFRTGILQRDVEWRSPRGQQVIVTSRRLVSFSRKNLFAIQYEIKSVNFSGYVTLRSVLDGHVKNVEAGEDLRIGVTVDGPTLQLLMVEQQDDFSALSHRTRNSGLMLVSAIENELTCKEPSKITRELACVDQRLEHIYRVKVGKGDTLCLKKYVAYFSSRDHAEAELMPLAKKTLSEARKAGFNSLCSEQKEFLSDTWNHGDVEITGNDALQQAVRFNQYHLLQSVGRDGRTSIAAKGLTGEGYGGHYFWDTEIYVLPVFLYSRPQIARKLLEYRYSCLDKARERAREMNHAKGALYAWRTISGAECSAFFPAGTAQYHINADIAYAIKQYYEATGDNEFMVKYGAEILIETARIWTGIGTYTGRKNNQFCINGVTGPDEYTAIVNNNFYTNSMAQVHLRFASDIALKIKKDYPNEFNRIKNLTGLADNEPDEWAHAAEAMYLPYDEELAIHPQDDTFLSKKIWDLAEIPKECHPLMFHYHYLVIYRHQVCKQADVVLALLLLGNRFSLKEKKRDYDYYEPITTHDSSLSHSTFSVMASEVGYHDKAYEYFMHTARGDLGDLHGNTSYGVHIAAMGGTWMAVVYGFAGMRVYDGKLQFAPYLPDRWERYSFRIYFRSQLIQVEINAKEVKYQLLEGDGLQLSHHGLKLHLTQTHPAEVVPTASANSACSGEELTTSHAVS